MTQELSNVVDSVGSIVAMSLAGKQYDGKLAANDMILKLACSTEIEQAENRKLGTIRV